MHDHHWAFKFNQQPTHQPLLLGTWSSKLQSMHNAYCQLSALVISIVVPHRDRFTADLSHALRTIMRLYPRSTLPGVTPSQMVDLWYFCKVLPFSPQFPLLLPENCDPPTWACSAICLSCQSSLLTYHSNLCSQSFLVHLWGVPSQVLKGHQPFLLHPCTKPRGWRKSIAKESTH